MNTTVRQTGPFERVVAFELSDAEIDAAKTVAARRMSQDLKLKGFRPGKAPRPVVEAAVGSARLRTEAIEDAIPPRLTEVLKAEALSPAVNPELEDVKDLDGGVSVEVKVTLWPSLESPPAYRDREIGLESPVVTDADLEQQLERMREQFGQVEEVERPAAAGDFVSIDVSATIDDEPIDEAVATELLYRVGSGGLLEGADDHLLGMSAGDEVSFDAEPPAGLGDRANELATFSITVNEVKRMVLPDLTDEWVDENTEYDTVGELRTTLRARMQQARLSTLGRRFADRSLDTLVGQVDIEIPQSIIRSEMDQILHGFVHRLAEQEVTLEQYFEVSGLTREQFIGDLAAQADRGVRTRLVLDSIIEEAGLEVPDAELDVVLQRLADQTDDPTGFLSAIQGTPEELSLRSDMLRDKALATIMDYATPVDPDGNIIDLSLATDENDDVVYGEIVEDGEIEDGEIIEGEVVDEETADGGDVASESDQESK